MVTAVRAAGLGAFAVALAALLTLGRPPLGVALGEPAPRVYKARARFVRTDYEATRMAREAARRAEPAVFRPTGERWSQAADALVNALRRGPDALLWQRLPEELDRDAFAGLLPRLQERADAVEAVLKELDEARFAALADLEEPLVARKTVEQVRLQAPTGESQLVPTDALAPLRADSPAFERAFGAALDGLEPKQAALARRAFAALLAPGLELDREQSTENADRAAAETPEVTEVVEEGRVLLAKGSEARKQHIEDLLRERAAYWSGPAGRAVRLQRLGGLVVLMLLVVGGGLAYAGRYRRQMLTRTPQLLAFALVTLALVAIARASVVWGVTPLWVPVPIVVMIMCLVYDQRFGLGTAAFYALLVRLACPGADMEFLVLLLGGITAALLAGQVRTRTTLIKTGLLTGAVQFCAVWGLGLMSAFNGSSVPLQFWESPLLGGSLAALGNGVLSGFVVSGILPAIESLFHVTTDIRLLEWSDPNQPLLQRMLLNAPGSYHHSMVVGSLAAEAAEAIGANALLARVSAYFHDIGKLKKPEYFAENLPPGMPNPHDELSPTMSSLIITAHPKDGAEMAEQFGVPPVVRDIILQSHGSGVVRYFWDKARKSNDDKGEVEERDFRYRLPRPRSREAAIVMLCDAVESAARSMGPAASAGQLQDLVHRIIMDRLHDGQLDESNLTITDLKALEDCLVRGIRAVFHSRVSYPGQEEAAEREGEPAPAAARAGSAGEGNGTGDSGPPEGC
jgi:hypothetical protein